MSGCARPAVLTYCFLTPNGLLSRAPARTLSSRATTKIQFRESASLPRGSWDTSVSLNIPDALQRRWTSLPDVYPALHLPLSHSLRWGYTDMEALISICRFRRRVEINYKSTIPTRALAPD